MKTCTIKIQANNEIDIQTDDMPTIDIINALDGIMRAFCRMVVGEETEDSEKLAQQMRDHMLHGRYELSRNKKTADDVNKIITRDAVDTNLISDGFHTFGELYAHRIALWIALCEQISHNPDSKFERAWRTERHSDGELAFGGGWFVLGVGEKAGEQMTYHLPMSYWDSCYFATILESAPEWDGHSAGDVLTRLAILGEI